MKKLKYQILFTILFMTIGIAAVTTNLITNGTTPIASNQTDFYVYFSDINIHNGDDKANILVKTDSKFTFNTNLQSLNDNITIHFYVTNSSINYDANVNISCTENSDYITFNSTLEDSIIPSRERILGTLDVTLSKTYTGERDLEQEITCSINANAIERTASGSGTVSNPIKNEIQLVSGDGTNVGDEMSFAGENFYVVSNDGTEVVLLAKYNLDIDTSTQSDKNADTIAFSNTNYWYDSSTNTLKLTYGTSYPAYIYDDNTSIKTYVDNYETYLEGLGLTVNSSRLIKQEELVELGCREDDMDCRISWVRSTSYWSGTAYNNAQLWYVLSHGVFAHTSTAYSDNNTNGIRPVIVIPAENIEPKLISFTVNGGSYQAEEGMTWQEYLESGYNVSENSAPYFYAVNNSIFEHSNGAPLSYEENSYSNVLITDTIIENNNYYMDYY